jgi:hypothetical protein
LEGNLGPVTAQDLGSFASIMNAFVKVQRAPQFWDVARGVHQDIQEFVAHGGPSFYYNLARTAIRQPFSRAISMLPGSHNRRPTVLATTYGVANMRNVYGTLRTRGCILTFPNDLLGPSLVMEALVLGQTLNIGFSAVGLLPQFWEQLHLAVREHLDRAAGALD